LLAAAAGSLTTGLFFHPNFSLPIAQYNQWQLVDIFSGAIVTLIALPSAWLAFGAYRVYTR
jgi:H+/Cl- antiporter ClcA